jgi:hypothetical protein
MANDLVVLPGPLAERKVTGLPLFELPDQPLMPDSKSQLAHLVVPPQMATFEL